MGGKVEALDALGGLGRGRLRGQQRRQPGGRAAPLEKPQEEKSPPGRDGGAGREFVPQRPWPRRQEGPRQVGKQGGRRTGGEALRVKAGQVAVADSRPELLAEEGEGAARRVQERRRGQVGLADAGPVDPVAEFQVAAGKDSSEMALGPLISKSPPTGDPAADTRRP